MFRERVSWPLWFHFILSVVVAISVAGVAGILRRGEPAFVALLPALGGLAVGYIWWRMRYLEVECGPEGAAFGFGGILQRVGVGQIESAVPEDYRVTRYMGWGWRIGRERGDRAYSVIGYRRGLRLVYTAENGKKYSTFLACSKPEEACAALPASVRKVSGSEE